MTALSLVRLRPELAGEILILEAKEFPREKVCGGGVSGRVTAALEGLGVSLEGIPRVPVNRFSVYYERKISEPSFGNDKCFVTRRSAFDALLLEQAADRGVEVRMHTPAVGAYRERRGIAVVDRGGRTHRAEVAVGADGVAMPAAYTPARDVGNRARRGNVRDGTACRRAGPWRESGRAR